jgi:hypothetical protein
MPRLLPLKSSRPADVLFERQFVRRFRRGKCTTDLERPTIVWALPVCRKRPKTSVFHSPSTRYARPQRSQLLLLLPIR